MQDIFETITRGNVTEVKVVLATVVAALAVYQVVLMAVGYQKLRPPFLAPGAASASHRAIGDAIVVVTTLVALMCISYFELEENTLHVVSASALLAVLALKILVLRRWHGMGRYLPVLGLSVLVLFLLTWTTSAGNFLADN
jgi:hypothetical protein